MDTTHRIAEYLAERAILLSAEDVAGLRAIVEAAPPIAGKLAEAPGTLIARRKCVGFSAGGEVTFRFKETFTMEPGDVLELRRVPARAPEETPAPVPSGALTEAWPSAEDIEGLRAACRPVTK